MFELIKQRLQSKTYWLAVIGALLTYADANSGVFSQFLPIQDRQYLVMLWPVIMLTAREITNNALADK